MIPLRITAKVKEIVCVMGTAATVASKEVRNSFLHVRVQSSQILHILRFITVIFFFFLIPSCVPAHKASVKILTALSRIQLMEKIKAVLLNGVDGQKNIRSSIASIMYGVISFQCARAC